MVDGTQQVTAGASGSNTSSKGKGKSKAVEEPEPEHAPETEWQEYDEEEWTVAEEAPAHPCPITDKDTNPFRLMDLPTEIRLEIYRACLTRPYNILLSKREKPQQVDFMPEHDDDMSGAPESSPSDVSDNDAEPAAAAVPSGTLPPNIIPSFTNESQSARQNAVRRAVSSSSLRVMAARDMPQQVSFTSHSVSAGSASNNAVPATSSTQGGSQLSNTTAGRRSRPARASHFRTVSARSTTTVTSPPEPERNQLADPLLVNILRTSKDIYKEARGVFYSENMFTLDLNTAMSTLACLHQRSRRHIKYVELEIPTYNEILERFQETVRLSLRYCSGLKTLVIHMPFTLPGADGSGTTGNTTVYANGFDILRWLPQQCAIELRGNICTEIETVVNKHLHLAKTLDKVRYQMYSYNLALPYELEVEEWKLAKANQTSKKN